MYLLVPHDSKQICASSGHVTVVKIKAKKQPVVGWHDISALTMQTS